MRFVNFARTQTKYTDLKKVLIFDVHRKFAAAVADVCFYNGLKKNVRLEFHLIFIRGVNPLKNNEMHCN